MKGVLTIVPPRDAEEAAHARDRLGRALDVLIESLRRKAAASQPKEAAS